MSAVSLTLLAATMILLLARICLRKQLGWQNPWCVQQKLNPLATRATTFSHGMLSSSSSSSPGTSKRGLSGTAEAAEVARSPPPLSMSSALTSTFASWSETLLTVESFLRFESLLESVRFSAKTQREKKRVRPRSREDHI